MAKKALFTRRQTLFFWLSMFTSLSVLTSKNALKPRQIDPLSRNFVASGNMSIGKRALIKGLSYGAAVNKNSLSSNPQLAASIDKECIIIVPEWELKWEFLRPTSTSFDFIPADWLAEFARTHGLLFRGHTLVWHEALPTWFVKTINSQNARQLLLEHITTVVKHYAGNIHSWDVVNEAINLQDGRSDGLRKTPWLQFIGRDYIEIAFRAAAEADPKAMLVYNDYGLEYDTPEHEAKRKTVLNLLKELKSKGTPIHALGIQSHLSGNETRFNSEKFLKFLSEIASLDLKILITEIDVKDKNLPVDIKVRDRIVAATYEDYLSVVLDEPAVIAVLTWGLSDRYTWLSEAQPRRDGARVRPLPLDANFKRKLAWNAIARAFDNAPQR
jgi:endo-1,4-beta-xylanase